MDVGVVAGMRECGCEYGGGSGGGGVWVWWRWRGCGSAGGDAAGGSDEVEKSLLLPVVEGRERRKKEKRCKKGRGRQNIEVREERLTESSDTKEENEEKADGTRRQGRKRSVWE